jgi:hypothetical protein
MYVDIISIGMDIMQSVKCTCILYNSSASFYLTK